MDQPFFLASFRIFRTVLKDVIFRRVLKERFHCIDGKTKESMLQLKRRGKKEEKKASNVYRTEACTSPDRRSNQRAPSSMLK